MRCECGGEMSLSVRISPKPYRYEHSCTCGKSFPADEEKAKQAIDYAVTKVVLTVITQEGGRR